MAETRILSTEIQQAQRAQASAESAFTLEKGRYETGLDPYITLLSTQTALLTSRETVVNLQVEQMTSAVQLVEALGGGWDTSQLPTASQVTQKPPADERKIQQ